MAKPGPKPGSPSNNPAGRPKGALGKFNAEGKQFLAELLRVGAADVPALLIKLKKTKPEAYIAALVNAAKHITPPARAAEPGTEDRPMVIEVRTRGGATTSEDTHQSEAASAAAHLRRRGFTEGDDED